MTESDWHYLLKWNNDPDVLRTAEGDSVEGYTLEQIKNIYCSVSEHGYCFMIEVDGRTIGECWLQQMNLDRILSAYPEHDIRRIDLVIGEADYRGRGFGTEVVATLTRFAFEQEQADLVFGCDIAEDNPASLGAFLKAGYIVHDRVVQPPGAKTRFRYDVKAQRSNSQGEPV
jgi:RimJ/RimL family protein N-acetyltransferase